MPGDSDRPASELIREFLQELSKTHTSSRNTLSEIKCIVSKNSHTLGELQTEIKVQGTRLSTVESRIGNLETARDKAEEHEIKRLESQLADYKESKKHWLRYVVAALVGIITMVSAGILGFLSK